jgi:hypothetical protein
MTEEERKRQVRRTVETLDKALANKRARAVVGPQGAVTFTGEGIGGVLAENRVSDACAYRKIMATGSALARAAIARAEQLAGRSVDRATVAAGVHSHDGGKSWNAGH